MDNTKYKSVAVPNKVHSILKELAHQEGRTIGGQMSYMVQTYLKTVDMVESSK